MICHSLATGKTHQLSAGGRDRGLARPRPFPSRYCDIVVGRPARASPQQKAFARQVSEVSCRRYSRGAGDRLVFSRSHSSFESARSGFQHLVECLALSLVERCCPMIAPEASPGQGFVDELAACLAGGYKGIHEPKQPSGDVASSALSLIERGVVGCLALSQFDRYAVQSKRRFRVLRERHVDYCPAHATIAVLERMDGFKPEMRKPSAHD